MVIIPRKGFYIREIIKKEIEEMYNIGQVLESYATELAVPRINDIDINRLEKVFKKAKSDLKYNKAKSVIETDIELHLLSRIKLQTPVWRCGSNPKGSSSFFACSQKMPPAPAGGVSLLINNCGNEYLKKIVNKYNDRYAFYRIINLSRVERAKKSYFEHYKIFKAIKEKDVKLSVKLMAKHIEYAKNIILNNFTEYTYGDIDIIKKPVDLYKK